MDTIANMLTTIRNAQAVNKETVVVPYSQTKMQIAKVMLQKKLIKAVDKKGKKIKTIEISLAYGKNNRPAIKCVKRISKPSRRVYTPFNKLRPVRGGLGFHILSTSKGVMTDEDAKEKKVGGEVICEIW